jgi:FAD:protein FMN transferase
MLPVEMTAFAENMRRFWLPVALAAVVLLAGCGRQREVGFAGRTMGTAYHIKVVAPVFQSTGNLAEKIEARLAAVNLSMSTYLPESEISRFNGVAEAGKPFCISADFRQVMAEAGRLFQLTGGAWDGTVAPLVELWGFGRGPKPAPLPSGARIAAALEMVGFDRIGRDKEGCLSKTDARVTLDLASIAKGFGVDAVAAVIHAAGYTDFLVEIGGEVYASGRRLDGRPWRVGINQPDPAAGADSVYRAVSLTDRAFATSGDYRNFFVKDGVRYSHLLDPRTGYPVTNGVVSASVIADTCTFADGLATALTVMGPESGLALVNRIHGVECLIVVQAADGRLIDHPSAGFR